jgi:two-component system phosphate regulon sensor histidine kinase PhoR
MEPRRALPWPGIVLALAGSLALIVVGGELWLAAAILLIWLGSLWLTSAEPPSIPQAPSNGMFTRDSMAELIEHSGTPLLLTERNRIAIANQAAREVLGAHIVGQDLRVALRHPKAIALADRDRPASTVVEGLARRRDIWRISRQPLSHDMAVIELINRTAEADISRAHTDFVANASHELRTPLASIIGYVETLSEESGADDAATREKFLGTILREARRLQSLVSDLMSLSRVEAEKHDQPAERIDLKPLVERAARDAAGSDREARLELACPEAITVPGDVQQLEQLVRNLVDNALKYGDPTQPVSVTLEREGQDGARLTVRDRGEGIESEHLPHLTRRFYRTHPGRSRASGGTGLGLAIVKHIVERHRGRLDIASTRNVGTTVTVRLPAIADADAQLS